MPQPPKHLDPTASPRAWFGAELRYWRSEVVGWTILKLADKAHVSREVVRRIEVGEYNCRLVLQSYFAICFDSLQTCRSELSHGVGRWTSARSD